jgi:hypothetical protein
MALSSIFKLRTSANPALLELLTNTTLGTNGAMYRHLDTPTRILEADNPLFLSLERNEKVLGNVTFCQRGSAWYMRYFAFHSFVQGGGVKKSEGKGNSFLKRELNQFFDEVFEGKHSENVVESMYAYIDPRNDRSKWMSENFGFKVVRQLVTQSFSRISPKKSNRLVKINDWEEIKPLVEGYYGQHDYYFTTHAKKAPFYGLKDEAGELIATCRATRVNWQIVRLPGKMGGFLTKVIPYIPLLNKLIKPKHHTFLVPEIITAKNNDPKLLEELFSAVLYEEKLNLMVWWIDQNDEIYRSVKHQIAWGLFHKIVGAHPVDVVERINPNGSKTTSRPVFVTAYDMI